MEQKIKLSQDNEQNISINNVNSQKLKLNTLLLNTINIDQNLNQKIEVSENEPEIIYINKNSKINISDVLVNGISVVSDGIAYINVPFKISQLANDSGFITKNVNDLVNYTLSSNLSTVATTGSYSDLSNKPSIPTKTSDLNNDSGFITKNVNDLVNYTLSSNLATVATSGSYSDLSNKPTIPTKTSDLNNDSGFITKNVNDLVNYTLSSNLATIATSGDYNDLINKPSIPSNVESNIYTSNGASIRFEKYGRIVICTFEGATTSNLTTNTDYSVSISSTYMPNGNVRNNCIFNENGVVVYVWVDSSQSKIHYRVKSNVSSPTYPRFSFSYISSN